MPTAFEQTLTAIDALHAQDPRHTTLADGTPLPQELAYAQRMSHWLEPLQSNPNELLRLAVRAQHLQRWLVPRSDYPEGRIGYLTWRRDQSARGCYHGEADARRWLQRCRRRTNRNHYP